MTTRTLLALTCACLSGFPIDGSDASASERPNFVFILVDDLGYADLGCYGSSFYDTPHLDAFASMVHAMDENVGRLLAKLDELDLSKNTVVMFTSDNGGLTTKPGKNTPTSVRPLRAGKGWCYEGGIRVPWIIRAPGVTKPGAKCETPIYSADAYPTILELAGLDARPNQHQDGRSLAGLLKGETSPERDFIVWHYPHYHGSNWRPGSAIRAGKWKLVEHYDYGKVELFNLEEDLGEQTDLSEKLPEKAKELRRKMHDYLKSVNAKLPEPNPAFDKSGGDAGKPARKKKRKKKA